MDDVDEIDDLTDMDWSKNITTLDTISLKY